VKNPTYNGDEVSAFHLLVTVLQFSLLRCSKLVGKFPLQAYINLLLECCIPLWVSAANRSCLLLMVGSKESLKTLNTSDEY